MNSRKIRQILAAMSVTFAYMTLVLNWLWLAVVAVPRLIESGSFDILIAPSEPVAPAAQTDAFTMSPLVWGLIGIVTLGILVMTVIVLIRLPRAIVQTGQRVVTQTANAVVPAITHHKPLPAKKKRILSRRIILALQLTLSLMPLVVCLFLPAYHELTRQIILTISLWLSVMSGVFFTAAWFVAPLPISRTRSRASRG